MWTLWKVQSAADDSLSVLHPLLKGMVALNCTIAHKQRVKQLKRIV